MCIFQNLLCGMPPLTRTPIPISGKTQLKFKLRGTNKVSLKGQSFLKVKEYPALVKYILAIPDAEVRHPQMLDLKGYLQQDYHKKERKIAAQAVRKSRVVYRLDQTDLTQKTIVDADEMTNLIKIKGKPHAMAGGLRCEHGHRMKFIPKHRRKDTAIVAAHFSHVTPPVAGAGSPSGNGGDCCGGVGPGGCSDKHLLAVKLLIKHITKLRFKRFRQCGKCVDMDYRVGSKAVADDEVTSVNSTGGKIRSDVAVYEDGKIVMTLEVLNSHKTDPASRTGVPYLEIHADHAIATLDGLGNSTAVLLCENSNRLCPTCDAAQNKKKQETAARFKRQRPTSYEDFTREDFTRSKITALGLGRVSRDHRDWDHFVRLTKFHPDCDTKFPLPIVSFDIERNELNFSQLKLYANFSDGSRDSFSWISCVRQAAVRGRHCYRV